MTGHTPLVAGALRLLGEVEHILGLRGHRPDAELLDDLRRAYQRSIPDADNRLRRAVGQ